MKHSNQSKGLFGKLDFIYKPETDEYEYECPAGQQAIYRFNGTDKGKTIRRYYSSSCPGYWMIITLPIKKHPH